MSERPALRGGGLAAYYDRLARWTAVARAVGYGGGRETLTVHRALADPRAGGRPTPARLHDVLASALPALDRPRVLDAGCGLGGTMIDLSKRLGGTYVGLTLSEKQAAIGRAATQRAGLERSIEFHVRSYDTPPDGPFDLIIAIESLAHSPDPFATVEGLVTRLAPGGVIAIVDDMPAASHSGRAAADLASFKKGWHCPVLCAAADYRRHLEQQGLRITADMDLTAHTAPRAKSSIAQLERLNRVMHRAIPSEGWRELMDSYYGGLALERLYRNRAMHYQLLVALLLSSSVAQ